jgi:acetyltransferase-like isoleucine patch superfamily enzyme/dTDP-4-dehydrorhamnose 3,5-epimerase-like enzyme
MGETGIRLHPASLVEAGEIGAGTCVGAFSRISAGARIGKRCQIRDHVCVCPGAVVGDDVVLHDGCRVAGGVVVEDGAVLGPQVVTMSSSSPAGGQESRPTRIGKGAAIGANATIVAGVTVGPRAVVGAGAVVTRNVPADAVVAGNPARITGYAGLTPRRPPAPMAAPPEQPGAVATRVRGVTFHFLPLVEDLRGNLAIGETARQVPFEIRRFFLVFGVADQKIRGEHAHRTLHQFLVCVHGSCHFVADDGENREEFILDRPNFGLYIPPMIWGVQYKYTPDAVLLVLASDHYDPADYIRDYTEFLSLSRGHAS